MLNSGGLNASTLNGNSTGVVVHAAVLDLDTDATVTIPDTGIALSLAGRFTETVASTVSISDALTTFERGGKVDVEQRSEWNITGLVSQKYHTTVDTKITSQATVFSEGTADINVVVRSRFSTVTPIAANVMGAHCHAVFSPSVVFHATHYMATPLVWTSDSELVLEADYLPGATVAWEIQSECVPGASLISDVGLVTAGFGSVADITASNGYYVKMHMNSQSEVVIPSMSMLWGGRGQWNTGSQPQLTAVSRGSAPAPLSRLLTVKPYRNKFTVASRNTQLKVAA